MRCQILLVLYGYGLVCSGAAWNAFVESQGGTLNTSVEFQGGAGEYFGVQIVLGYMVVGVLLGALVSAMNGLSEECGP